MKESVVVPIHREGVVRTGIRYNRWERAWQTVLPECPVCGHWVKALFATGANGSPYIKGVKHGTYAQDMECPLVNKEHALPHSRFQHLVTDYEAIESRMLGAREDQRRRELTEERRLNPQEGQGPQHANPFTIGRKGIS
mgnify:CR=1 FL=1